MFDTVFGSSKNYVPSAESRGAGDDHPMAWTLNRGKQDAAYIASKAADKENDKWATRDAE